MSRDTGKLLDMGSGAGRKSKFTDIESQLLAEIEKWNNHTQQQIAEMVKEQFDVNVLIMAVSRLFIKNGIKILKSDSLLANTNPIAQRTFSDSELLPLMEKAKEKYSRDVLLFLDASHYVMGNDFLGAIYERYVALLPHSPEGNEIMCLVYSIMPQKESTVTMFSTTQIREG